MVPWTSSALRSWALWSFEFLGPPMNAFVSNNIMRYPKYSFVMFIVFGVLGCHALCAMLGFTTIKCPHRFGTLATKTVAGFALSELMGNAVEQNEDAHTGDVQWRHSVNPRPIASGNTIRAGSWIMVLFNYMYVPSNPGQVKEELGRRSVASAKPLEREPPP